MPDNLATTGDSALTPSSEAGLAPLLLTVTELVRQLMEAQVIRRMEAGQLADADLDRAAESLRRLEAEILAPVRNLRHRPR
jgi:hypothetical protein